jgi:pimeloyl-ACP methyl ester carboxylesterase
MTMRALSTAKRLAAAPPTGKAGPALLAGAAVLAVAALWNNIRARQAERDHPPAGRFIEVDGIRLHYLERGSGPAVVLLHGNVVSAEDYVLSGVFAETAARHRVIAFDRPGFGYSDRPHGTLWTPAGQARLLRQAFAQMGLERPVVVGHSWGTLAALALALDHPEAVGGLVLLSGYYKPTARLDVLLAALTAIPVIGDVLRHTVSPLLGSAMLPLNVKAMFAPQAVPDRFHQDFPYGFPVRPSQIRAESQDAVTMAPGAAALRNRYSELELPVTIMAGTEDNIVGVDGHAVWLHEALPGSVLRLVPNAGHMLHYAVPELVAQAIETVAQSRQASDPTGAAGKISAIKLEQQIAA